ncbi:phosphoglycolate phosphatase-like HAD superfamily hydrolase [Haloferula luteola]|uniref:phosphoglycolate phosphatase n=1 Tax=Haloferula luteola TaxID=595692 RepID=A0A840V076_9BACT|nr:NUDIX domain-containing protein [Haloferula luteola]MBB5351767.1 phosphoglycolate phosphatase-like HAD superfamily hydrolase [Haloferula luteola]
MFRNLIFDWSGTLVDDLPPVLDATNQVLGVYGVPPMDRETFRLRFRLPYREFYEEMLPGVPLEELEVHFRKAFSGSSEPVTVLPHAREKLAWCQAQGIRCFVLTSMDSDAFRGQLEDFGLAGYFEATYSGVLDKREVILEILDRHRLAPGETAFVGDMTHDVETAHHAQLTSVAVLTGYTHAGALALARPHLTVQDLDGLRRLMERPTGKARPVATVGALIENDEGQVLMVRTHKWGHRWGIPGGKIERGENAAAALVREVREETGLEIAEPVFVMVQDCIDSDEFERREHFLLLNYLARKTSGEVCLNDEAQEFRWLTPEEALKLDLNQPTRLLIEEVLEGGTP